MRKPVFPNTAVLFAAAATPGSRAADPRKAARGVPAGPLMLLARPKRRNRHNLDQSHSGHTDWPNPS